MKMLVGSCGIKGYDVEKQFIIDIPEDTHYLRMDGLAFDFGMEFAENFIIEIFGEAATDAEEESIYRNMWYEWEERDYDCME